MDLLRELKAMPVTLHLLQVGPCVPPAWDSSWPVPRGLAWHKCLSWRRPPCVSVARQDKGASKDDPPCFSLRLLGSTYGTVALGRGIPLTSWYPAPAPWEPRRVCEEDLIAVPPA